MSGMKISVRSDGSDRTYRLESVARPRGTERIAAGLDLLNIIDLKSL